MLFRDLILLIAIVNNFLDHQPISVYPAMATCHQRLSYISSFPVLNYLLEICNMTIEIKLQLV